MRFRRVIKGLVALGLVIFLVTICVEAAFPTKNTSASSVAPSTAPSVAVPIPQVIPSAPPTPANSAIPTANSGGQQAAVSAAATAQVLLASVKFLPAQQITSVVQAIVAPDTSQAVSQAIASDSGPFATALGFASIDAANKQSSLVVQVLQYMVDQFDGTHAVVRLFTVTSWVTTDSQLFRVPTINVVSLQLINGKWLYVSSKDPSANKVPVPVTGATYDQTVASFRPYLKGFANYAQGS
jgi:hypothetical protein